MTGKCFFCNVPKDGLKFTTEGAFAIPDGFPVTEGHYLIVPHRHTDDFFTMTEEERHNTETLLFQIRGFLLLDDPLIDGFNIGMNCGEAAGQTVFHAHTHLIPRRIGDTPSPRGGVRGVIPNKMTY